MKKILQLLLLMTLFVVGCQKDNVDNTGVGVSADGYVKLKMDLTMPSMSTVVTTTKSGTEPKEKAIERLTVAVFASNETNKPVSSDRLLQIENLDVVGNVNSIYVNLKKDPTPCYILVVANYGEEGVAHFGGLTVGTSTLSSFNDFVETLDAIYEGVAADGSSNVGLIGSIRGALPMSTYAHSYANGIDEFSSLNIKMRATYARIVVDATSPTAANYKIISTTLQNGAKTSRVSLEDPVSESSGVEIIKYNETIKNDAETANIVSPIYLFPNSGVSGTNPTDIIICGVYTDAFGHEYQGFHKLRIRHKLPAPETSYDYDIKHNTSYKINITKVNSAGFLTMEMAEYSEPTNIGIEYDVEIVDEFSSGLVVSNGLYTLAVTNDRCIVYSSEDDGDVSIAAVCFGANRSDDVPLPEGSPSMTPKLFFKVDSERWGVTATGNQSPTYPNTVNIFLKKGFRVGDIDTITVRYGDLATKIIVERRAALVGGKHLFSDSSDGTRYISGQYTPFLVAGEAYDPARHSMPKWISFNGATDPLNVVAEDGKIKLNIDINYFDYSRRYTGWGESGFYFTKVDDSGRISGRDKIAIVQAGSSATVGSVVPSEAVRKSADWFSLYFSYVSAFWKASETEERIIRMESLSSNGWTAVVDPQSGDLAGSVVLEKYSGALRGAIAGSPSEVPAGVQMLSGSGSEDIKFRIGLRGVYTPTSDKPARYAVIRVFTENNTRVQNIYLRQGDNPDFVMSKEDPLYIASQTDDPTMVFVPGGRPLAKKVSVYNLTVPESLESQFVGGVNQSGHPQVGQYGASFVKYPTQIGAYFSVRERTKEYVRPGEWFVSSDVNVWRPSITYPFRSSIIRKAYHPVSPRMIPDPLVNNPPFIDAHKKYEVEDFGYSPYVGHLGIARPPSFAADMPELENDVCPKRMSINGHIYDFVKAGTFPVREDLSSEIDIDISQSVLEQVGVNVDRNKYHSKNTSIGYCADGFFDRGEIISGENIVEAGRLKGHSNADIGLERKFKSIVLPAAERDIAAACIVLFNPRNNAHVMFPLAGKRRRGTINIKYLPNDVDVPSESINTGQGLLTSLSTGVSFSMGRLFGYNLGYFDTYSDFLLFIGGTFDYDSPAYKVPNYRLSIVDHPDAQAIRPLVDDGLR